MTDTRTSKRRPTAYSGRLAAMQQRAVIAWHGGMNTIASRYARLHDAPRELWFIYVVKFLESYAYYSLSYILLIYLSDEFGYTDIEAGWAYGIMGSLASVYGFVFGFVIDNLGVRKSLILGCCVNLVARLIVTFTASRTVMSFALYTLLPMGTAFGIPVMQIGVRRYTHRHNRKIAFSLFYVMMNMAAATAAPAIDGFRVALHGRMMYHGHRFTNYRALLLSGCVMTALSLCFTTAFVKEISVPEDGKGPSVPGKFKIKKGSPISIAKRVCSDDQFWRYVALIFFLVGVRCVFRHLDATFPKYMVREFGKDAMFGSIIGLNPLIIILLVPVIQPFLAHCDTFTMINVGAFISGTAPLIMCFGPSYTTAILFVVQLSIGESIWSPLLYEYTVTIAEEGREGTYMALSHVPTFLATLITGMMSGVLLSEYCPSKGPRHSWKMWLIIGVCSSLSPIAIYLLRDYLRATPDGQRQLDRSGAPEPGDSVEKKGLLNDEGSHVGVQSHEVDSASI